MASTITLSEFKDALSRYPEVLKSIVKTPKPGSVSLEELDEFRYVEAPARFSSKTGKSMDIEDVKKLVDWKLRHGIFRPTLPKLVASNTTEQVQEATKDAFSHYDKSPSDIKTILQKLSTPLKGIGPATASLLLAVYDPDNVIFFSNEAYQWLCADGEKVSMKYTSDEFGTLFTKAKALMGRLAVSAIDIEKVAFVLMKETEPVVEPTGPKIPSGRPRGRPKKPDSEKKIVDPNIPRRGRGRPPKEGKSTTEDSTPLSTAPRGRPKKVQDADPSDETTGTSEATPAKKRGRPKKVNVDDPSTGTTESSEATPARKRGRPKKVAPEQTNLDLDGLAQTTGAAEATPAKKRGQPRKTDTPGNTDEKTPGSVGAVKRGQGRPPKARPVDHEQEMYDNVASPTNAEPSKRKAEDGVISDHEDKKAKL